MIENLPKWYKVASVSSFNVELLEKRSEAIEEISAERTYKWFLECIRLYLGKAQKNKDFKNEFFNSFKKHDALLLQEEFELESKVLAGAIISNEIEVGNGKSLYLAMALISGKFGVSPQEIVNIDIIQNAVDYLKKESIVARKPSIPTTNAVKYPTLKDETATPEAVLAYAKVLATVLKTFEKNADNQKKSYEHNLKILREESEIHWWVFREYSNTLDKPIKDLSGAEVPLALSKDLIQLIGIYPPPVNFKEFLSITISKVSEGLDKEFSMKEYIDILCEKSELSIDVDKEDVYNNLCPLHYACVQASQFSAWTGIFEEKTGLKTESNYISIDIAEQFLIEQTLFNLQF